MNRGWLVVAAAATGACGREAVARPAPAPSQESVAGSPPTPLAASIPATPSSAPPPTAPPGNAPAAASNVNPAVLPQSDPVGTPPPRCPNVGAFVKASAVVMHEPPSRRRPSTAPPSVLDIELTVAILPNPERVTFAPNRLTIAGGVLVEETFRAADPTRDVLLIRPMGTVGPEASLMVLFGVVCKGAEGYLRVPMKLASPWRDGDKVTVAGIDGS